jgi:hypothetical protein
MNMRQSAVFRVQARQEWDQARRKAFWVSIFNQLGGKSMDLLDFNEVSQRLRLKTAMYRGVQTIPLNKIVGSVGRYNDFNSAFLPRKKAIGARWQAVAALYLNPSGKGIPPIEVYKVGDSYFVRDGNHRVSVSRQLKLKEIEAHIWEYPELIEGVDGNADLDTILIEAQRRDFLEQTQLDKLRPDHNIRLTGPGAYTELQRQIAQYQKVLEKIDEQPIPYEDAVTAWYDMLYEMTIRVIEETGVMEQFPDRTAADFYVWITRYHSRLKRRYGRRVMLREAVTDFTEEQRSPLKRLWRTLKSLVTRSPASP